MRLSFSMKSFSLRKKKLMKSHIQYLKRIPTIFLNTEKSCFPFWYLSLQFYEDKNIENKVELQPTHHKLLPRNVNKINDAKKLLLLLPRLLIE